MLAPTRLRSSVGVLVWSRPLPRWLPRTSAVLLVRVGEGRFEWARGCRLHRQIQTRVRRFYDLHDRDGQVLSGSVFEGRSEEHTSELQSLMRISYAVFCLKKKK